MSTPEAAVPAAATATDLLLDVDDLAVAYRDKEGREIRIVDKVSFQLRRGEALGLAGESGCGKTTTALALLGLLPTNLYRASGTISINSTRGVMAIERRTERGLRDVRWNTVSIVFQGAMNALDPVQRVSDQIATAIRLHAPGVEQRAVDARIAELFNYVGISPGRAREYPHEFSGGMRQRVMIALALACGPELIIGDEPTTALDVMMQAQILELLEGLRRDFGLSMILITHDLSVLGETCDRVAIMYGGQIAETGPISEVYRRAAAPLHAAPAGGIPDGRWPARAGAGDPRDPARPDGDRTGLPLRAPLPRRPGTLPGDRGGDAAGGRRQDGPLPLCALGRGGAAVSAVAAEAPLFTVRDLKVHFPVRGTRGKVAVKALDGVNLDWRRGEVLGIVGESGCGKSTLGRTLMGLQPPTSGEVRFAGDPVRKSDLRSMRRRVQMVFQDPYQSLNPRMSVGALVQEPLQIHRVGRRGPQRVRASPGRPRRGRPARHPSASGTATRTSSRAASGSGS